MSVFNKKNMGTGICYDCNELLKQKTIEMLNKHDDDFKRLIEDFSEKNKGINTLPAQELFITVRMFQGCLDGIRIYRNEGSAFNEKYNWLKEMDIGDINTEEHMAEDGTSFNIIKREVEE